MTEDTNTQVRSKVSGLSRVLAAGLAGVVLGLGGGGCTPTPAGRMFMTNMAAGALMSGVDESVRGEVRKSQGHGDYRDGVNVYVKEAIRTECYIFQNLNTGELKYVEQNEARKYYKMLNCIEGEKGWIIITPDGYIMNGG